jgi:co-chaperonin GroES (HSP10)
MKKATKRRRTATQGREKVLAGHSLNLTTLDEALGIRDTSEQDAVDWVNDERRPLPPVNEILVPFGWKMLVMPMRVATETKGGIIIPQVRQDTDQYLNYVGRVVALGSLCFKHSKWAAMGLKPEDAPKRGDWVVYPIYQYQRIDFKGTKLILLNDDSFLATVPEGVSPWDFKLER